MRCDATLETDAEAECTDWLHEQFAAVFATPARTWTTFSSGHCYSINRLIDLLAHGSNMGLKGLALTEIRKL